MTALKERISSPLEAGLSILDAHHLPPNLTPALEYTSSRLAKKSLHLSLVIVRRDYQLPTIIPAHVSPGSYGSSGLGSPAPSSGNSVGKGAGFATSPVASFKNFFRSATRRVSKRCLDETSGRSATSPGLVSSNPLESPRFRWPLPLTPASPVSPPPMTPSTTTSLTSVTTAETNGPPTPNPCNLHFLYPSDLSSSMEKMMKATIAKAGTKFGLGTGWLSPFSSTSARELTDQLYRNSFVQNETLFSSDGLTLLTLDRLYSVKSALSSYSKTGSPMRLEDSVDELRRYVLASNGSRISRSDLLRSYDWLNVSNSAAADLDHMYRRAYGGSERCSGISGMPQGQERVPASQVPVSSFDDDSSDEDMANDDDDHDDDDDDDDDDHDDENEQDQEDDEHTPRVGHDHRYMNETGNEIQNANQRRNEMDPEMQADMGNDNYRIDAGYGSESPNINDIYDSYLYDQYHDADSDDGEFDSPDAISNPKELGLAITALPLKKPPTPKRIGPHLKVQTGFELRSRLEAARADAIPDAPPEAREAGEDDDDRTARPIERPAHPWSNHFTFHMHSSSSSNNNHLTSTHNPFHTKPGHPHHCGSLGSRSRNMPDPGYRPNPLSSHPIILRTLPSSDRLAPKSSRTPRVCEDLSPVTRSEWRLLMVDKGLRGRTAAVETC